MAALPIDQDDRLDHMKKNRVITPLLCLVLSGCTTLGPNYIAPSDNDLIPEQTKFTEQQQEMAIVDKHAAIENQQPSIEWWKNAFHNEQINGLVEAALKQNLNIRSAALRVLQSQQQLAIATANQYPQQQSITAGVSRQEANGSAFNNYNSGFNLSWEVDLWGRFQRQIESSQAQLDGNVANYDGVVISLISQVVKNYILIRTYQRRIDVSQLSIQLQEENYRIALAKANAGDTSELDVDQALSLLNNSKASVPSLQISLQQSKNALALLLGESPQALNYILNEQQAIPIASPFIALGMPQDLIRRRPDIRVAERSLAAQSAQIGFAASELYPHFSIGGSIGNSADSMGNLFNSNSKTWSIFSAFEWDIFNYGRLQSNVRLQDALFQQLLIDYKNIVLSAQVEVENKIVAYLKNQEQVTLYETSAAAAKRAADIATFQYQNGAVNFNTVINTLVSYSQQEDLLASHQGAIAASLVDVYLALGGGWQIRGS
ncbi:efflux transporter outer membrane subunit [Psychromonas sp. MME2]|uniref:efflux transporter outer membrane subunit n=1 Tax=Psychromonas sp. MME2 TaxID=3231033 RepID=UPI00339CBB14